MQITEQTTTAKTAFQLKVELAFRSGEYGLSDIVWNAGKAAALEGHPLQSPLIDLAAAKNRGYSQTSLGWMYERAYWAHAAQNRPETYFNVEFNGPWVTITSKGVAGGKGSVSLHKHDVWDFFYRARSSYLTDYERWCTNPYPVGGHTVLMRITNYFDIDEDDRSIPREDEGILTIDPDTHPSSGRIYFGDPAQEVMQLGALCQLEDIVTGLLSAASPTEEDRLATARRADAIAKVAGMSFMPSSGYCSTCEADVTHALVSIKPGAMITGCPVCGRSWCD